MTTRTIQGCHFNRVQTSDIKKKSDLLNNEWEENKMLMKAN